MKLDHDCVRSLLLSIESWDSQDPLFLRNLKEMPLLNVYPDDVILYTASKLKERNFIIAQPLVGDNRLMDMVISELTWDGHEFLDNIRDNQIWKETKNTAAKVTGASLSILSEIAKNYVAKTLGLS